MKWVTWENVGIEPDVGAQVGLRDSLFGLKYRFLDQERSGVSASFYPQLYLNDPANSFGQNSGGRGRTFFLPMEISRSIGKLELGAEVGYEFIQHQRDEWALGVAAGYPVTKKLELLAEIRAEIDRDFRRNDELIFNSGTRWNFSEHVGLLFAVGRSVYDRPDSTELLVYSGLQFKF